jgi:hypothetical protein
MKVLRGDRCRCSGCGEYFNSTYMFDKHRFGKYPDRRCMTAEEMSAKGYSKNEAGFWISSKAPSSLRGGLQEPSAVSGEESGEDQYDCG